MGNLQAAIQKKTNVTPNVVHTATALSVNKKKDLIDIPISTESYKSGDKFTIKAVYSDQESLKNIFDAIQNYMSKKYSPIKFQIGSFNEDSFVAEILDYDGMYDDGEYCEPQRVCNCTADELAQHPISWYDKNEISWMGLRVRVFPSYEHVIISTSIGCKHMTEKNSNNPLNCPIYKSMTEKYQFNKENLSHLNQFNHFLDETTEKPPCQYADECKSFIRLENGGNRLDDACHMKLYRHPPRKRNIKLSENCHSLLFNKRLEDNCYVYRPTKDDGKKYDFNETDGFLNALVAEVISNGFKYDLCLSCAQHEECKHDDISILKLVGEKLNCRRHFLMGNPLNKAEMLSLILYTGCECNYDLCTSQRSGDYIKWKWFDYCICGAIRKLSKHESGFFSVFSGLNGVKLDKKKVRDGFFVTYVSTSWRKEVSQTFIRGNEGMIIQFARDFRKSAYTTCCDVSWISKFPDECEILFQRSISYIDNKFSGAVVDESNGVQTILLTKNDEIVDDDGDRMDVNDFGFHI